MYIESVPNRNSPPAILLRESYRDENGKVRKRTLANLSKWDPQVVEGLRSLLRGGTVSPLPMEQSFKIVRSLSHGNVAAVLGSFRNIGLDRIISSRPSQHRDLSIAMITARILHPSSKLALSLLVSEETTNSTLGQELGLKTVSENDLYPAMRWLYERQPQIEEKLARGHLKEGTTVLYDLSSTYYEGSHCPLAEFGHTRDKKKGKRQINFGLLCNADGCPIAVEAFPGSTADPATVDSQIKTLRERFGLDRVIVVGDRGMLTNARIQEIKADPDQLGINNYGWISALRFPQIRELHEAGSFEPELFDQMDLAEISNEELFPGERLVVCRNPFLAEERSKKREKLLKATEKKLETIKHAVMREKNPYTGADRIGRRVERECAKFKMLKHFHLERSNASFNFHRNENSIKEEVYLDGFYIVRAGRVGPKEMSSEKLVETYKSLSKVERNFRAIKTTALQVRPIFHRTEDMVRAHIFICMLAAHLRWHMEQKLKPVLFYDEVPGGSQRKNPVQKAKRSDRAMAKIASKKNEDNLPVHSFETLLKDLSSLSRNTIAPAIKGSKPFFKLTEATPIQQKALALLNVSLRHVPGCTQ